MKKKLLVATVLFLSVLLSLLSGCEQLKPNSIGIGYSPPYYEDTPMWRGLNINARWDLK